MRGHDHGAPARARRGEPPHARVPEPRGAGSGPRSAARMAAACACGVSIACLRRCCRRLSSFSKSW